VQLFSVIKNIEHTFAKNTGKRSFPKGQGRQGAQEALALDKKGVVWYSISVTKAFLRPFFDFLCVFLVFFCRKGTEISPKSA